MSKQSQAKDIQGYIPQFKPMKPRIYRRQYRYFCGNEDYYAIGKTVVEAYNAWIKYKKFIALLRS
jgi:hypothetical protein